MNNQIHLIARLKQQPRQGSGNQDAFTLLTKQAKELYTTFAVGGKDIVRASGFKQVTEAITGAYEKVNILEKQNRKLSESFGVTTMRAAQLSQQFDKVGISLGVNTDKLKTYAGELKKLFPGQAAYLAKAGEFGKTILKQAELLRNKLGLSSEITEGFIRNQALLSQKSTDNFDTLNQEIAQYSSGLRGTYEGAFADITEGIGSLDAETAAVFGKQGIGNLSKAVLGAKKLGVELGKVLATGTGFLDVEQAIGNEIELQILGAKDLNVAKIQEARLQGDGAALTQEITKYLEANGEAMKDNPFLLQKSADALGFTNSELLEMYANLKQNNKLEADVAKTNLDRITAENKARLANGQAAMTDKEKELFLQKEINDVLETESKRRKAAKEDDFKTEAEREQFLADQRSETKKAEDISQQGYAQSILDAGSQAEQVMKLAAGLSTSMDGALDLSKKVVTALGNSTIVSALFGATGFLESLQQFIGSFKTPPTAGPGTTVGVENTEKGGDVFIPATGGNVISGAFGSFELDPRDDILAMPNARDAISNQGSTTSNITTQGGTDTAALIAALQAMSFHVTNTFDGDKIQSQLTIRQGQRLNA
jgi:hypothetical protein